MYTDCKENLFWNIGNEMVLGEILSAGKINLSPGKVFEIWFSKRVQTLSTSWSSTNWGEGSNYWSIGKHLYTKIQAKK